MPNKKATIPKTTKGKGRNYLSVEEGAGMTEAGRRRYNDIQEFLHTNQTHNTHEYDHTILHPDQHRSSENVSEVRLRSDS